MSEEEFKNVWYLAKEITWQDKSLFPYKRSATLKLKGDCIEVICNDELIKITNIEHISIGKQGRDFFNNWVKIDYDNGKTAYFADGNSMGWSGVMGGTNRIFTAIKNNIKSEVKMEEPVKELENFDEEIISGTKDEINNDITVDTKSEEKIKGIDSIKTIQYKDKAVAILLSIFFGFWAWIYTWEKDKWKFWIGLGVTIITLGYGYIAFWIWAIIDAASRTQEFYNNYTR